MTRENEQACALQERSCEPCKGGVPPLEGEALKKLHEQIDNNWSIVNEHHLSRTFKFENWREAQAFANRVGDLAEAEGHHPDLRLSYGQVDVDIWTHKIDGLTESDFVLAAKIDHLDK